MEAKPAGTTRSLSAACTSAVRRVLCAVCGCVWIRSEHRACRQTQKQSDGNGGGKSIAASLHEASEIPLLRVHHAPARRETGGEEGDRESSREGGGEGGGERQRRREEGRERGSAREREAHVSARTRAQHRQSEPRLACALTQTKNAANFNADRKQPATPKQPRQQLSWVFAERPAQEAILRGAGARSTCLPPPSRTPSPPLTPR
eukprot:3057067-Rhodomonas_salina.5